MESDDLRALLTPQGLDLIHHITESNETDPVREVSRLRAAGYPQQLVGAAMTQATLRRKAADKFGGFAERMLFTQSGLEQATQLRVASRHAGRYRDAGIGHITDLGCGIGADSLAFAGLGASVRAVEADEVTAAIAGFNLAPFPDVEVTHARAEDHDLSDTYGVFLDPARRTAGHNNTRRLTNPDTYSPSLTFAFALADRVPTGIKLGPGFDRDLIPANAEAQWVSVDGQVVETGLWFGPLARTGITRSALVLTDAGASELTAAADATDPEPRPLGEFLYEPDGAVIRARQIGALAEQLNAGTLDPSIAYLTTDTVRETPFATGFRVLETLPLDVKRIKRELARLGVGTLEIKKRGVDIDPAVFRRELKLRGPESMTLILTRIGTRRVAVLASRLRSGA